MKHRVCQDLSRVCVLQWADKPISAGDARLSVNLCSADYFSETPQSLQPLAAATLSCWKWFWSIDANVAYDRQSDRQTDLRTG